MFGRSCWELIGGLPRRTEGAEVPQVIMKQAKYATVMDALISMAEKMTNPQNVKKNPRATKGKRQRVRSDEKPRTSNMTAPVMLGATVYRFVLRVP